MSNTQTIMDELTDKINKATDKPMSIRDALEVIEGLQTNLEFTADALRIDLRNAGEEW